MSKKNKHLQGIPDEVANALYELHNQVKPKFKLEAPYAKPLITKRKNSKEDMELLEKLKNGPKPSNEKGKGRE